MLVLHFLMAALAVGRLTELITQDKITEQFRNKWPIYLWTCQRCVSVWAGIWCSIMFMLYPFGNWPLALSWLYLIINQIMAVVESFTRKPAGIHITPLGEGAHVDWGGIDPQMATIYLRKIINSFDEQMRSDQLRKAR